MNSETPHDLMRQFQEGDEEAFQELVRRYKEPIVSFVMRMLNDREKAVDVAQETFINVFTHADSYRPVASFTGWLYRIAYNLAINEIRRQKRQPAISLDAPAPGQDADSRPLEPRDDREGIEEQMLQHELHENVRRCVAALPARYRGAIVMKDMEGMTFEEIAVVLGCPESTVKSRVMRGRRMLRTRLEAYLAPAAETVPARLTARHLTRS
ncbi:MAG: RNA polymerase sigma factor [Candidatus Polarisedimenticolia bacterium]